MGAGCKVTKERENHTKDFITTLVSIQNHFLCMGAGFVIFMFFY